MHKVSSRPLFSIQKILLYPMILLATSEGIDQKADLGFCWSNMPEDSFTWCNPNKFLEKNRGKTISRAKVNQ